MNTARSEVHEHPEGTPSGPIDGPGDRAPFHHCAGFHDGQADLLAQLVPVVEDGLRRGDALVLGVHADTMRALHEEFGELPGARRWHYPVGLTAGSGQNTAFRRARQLESLAAAGSAITAIAQHDPRLDGPDGHFWTELDAAANLSMGSLPLRLTCFFPRFTEQPAVFAGAYRNHPALLRASTWVDNPGYRAPEQLPVVTAVPPPLGPPAEELTISARQLVDVRDRVERRMWIARCRAEHVDDAVLAVNEVVTNALRHGNEPARVELWDDPDGCIVEVHNEGRSSVPLPGMHPPAVHERHGWGLWAARKATDYLHFWTDDAATHVRLRVEYHP